MCSLGGIGVITSLRTSGFPRDLKVQIYQGPHTISGSKGIPHILTRPHGPISKTARIQTTISGSIIKSPDSYTASGLQSRSQDLEKRPPGLQNDLRIQGKPSGSSTTFGSPDDPRVLMQPPGYKNNLQTPRAHVLENLTPPGTQPVTRDVAATSGFLGYPLTYE